MGRLRLSCTDVGTDRLALREWRSERCPTLPDCRQSSGKAFSEEAERGVEPRERPSSGAWGFDPHLIFDN